MSAINDDKKQKDVKQAKDAASVEEDPKLAAERLVEDDDEFAEFEPEAWQGDDPNDDENQWADNWDDDDVDMGFLNQLRAEIVNGKPIDAPKQQKPSVNAAAIKK